MIFHLEKHFDFWCFINQFSILSEVCNYNYSVFLTKSYRIFKNTCLEDYMWWTETGLHVEIADVDQFCPELLSIKFHDRVSAESSNSVTDKHKPSERLGSRMRFLTITTV